MAKSTTSRIIGWAVKAVIGLMIGAILGVLLWRIMSSGDPASMKALQPNDKLCDAYAAYLADTDPDKGDFIIVHQRYDTIIREGEAKGYFSVTQADFLPAADQLQITFRYNNSTLKYVAEDFGKPEPLERGQDWFDVTVTVAYDLTPDNDADNSVNDPESVRFERYQPTACVKDTKNLYNYERLTFDGIDILDHIDENGEPVMRADVLAVYVDIYFNEDIHYDQQPLGTLIIYVWGTEENRPTFVAPISDKDAQALANFSK
jgi:hypothetical protein